MSVTSWLRLVLLLGMTLGLVALLVAIPVALFSPARFKRPWMAVSVLTVITFIFATVLLLSGHGC